MLTANDRTMQTAAKHLCNNDPLLAAVIDRVGPCTLKPHGNYYQQLVESIIGQQLSVKAARAIKDRFHALGANGLPIPDEIIVISEDTLRTAGLSRPKISYIKDLAMHVLDGRIQLEKFDQLSNDEIIAELTAVKGIGVWTVHMYLIFCLGRLDVLPVGDLGIRNGIQKLYGFELTPTVEDMCQVAAMNQWHPYESVASWYVWRSLELPPV